MDTTAFIVIDRQITVAVGTTISDRPPAEIRTSASTHTALTKDEWRKSNQDRSRKAGIELKFPRNGQYPEQMFNACKDVAFLEQLVDRGFDFGLFVMAAEDKLFYQGADTGDVYSYFRSGKPICGLIRKPTGTKDELFTIRGAYILSWHKLPDLELRYACISVIPEIAKIAAVSERVGVDA